MIYYNQEDLIIRSMNEQDIEDFPNAFKKQGWIKPASQFRKYYNQQEAGERWVIVAEKDGEVAGYVTLVPQAQEGPFANKGIPEIVDFNVLIKYQRLGIGSLMLDIVENIAREKSEYVSLGVGLHSGYGQAQRLYIKRGYIPDGTGVWYDGEQLKQYVPTMNDDSLNLYMLKKL